jgi:hypothetical protein
MSHSYFQSPNFKREILHPSPTGKICFQHSKKKRATSGIERST